MTLAPLTYLKGKERPMYVGAARLSAAGVRLMLKTVCIGSMQPPELVFVYHTVLLPHSHDLLKQQYFLPPRTLHAEPMSKYEMTAWLSRVFHRISLVSSPRAALSYHTRLLLTHLVLGKPR
ncbi:hypothetical protein PMIN01_05962 [Paraphaeosphaeria minitans]|uniref:Uncharacterized protein n=1 Tax=Paraphaeosphaeria minitans TaxID=565426 RepID=A0A9P6GI47_9PLEO|nr:hypothetical protein PMIN01_05962 [Paraphaeosphaeria minitans]